MPVRPTPERLIPLFPTPVFPMPCISESERDIVVRRQSSSSAQHFSLHWFEGKFNDTFSYRVAIADIANTLQSISEREIVVRRQSSWSAQHFRPVQSLHWFEGKFNDTFEHCDSRTLL
jgi:hypothetical protein